MTMDVKIEQIVLGAIDEVNAHQPKDQQISRSMDTVLYGSAGELDSLSLINFIVAAEQLIEKEFGATVNLIDENTLVMEDSPLRTARTLADHIRGLLQAA